MSEARYNVVVSGAVLDGFELSEVKEEFAKLFQLGEAKAELIFNKGDVVIKRGVAETTANKFIQALERIGAAAHLLPHTEQHDMPEPLSENQERLSSQWALATGGTSSEQVIRAADVPPTDGVEENITPAVSPNESTRPFVFHGNGSEYFRIWIVNILLSIVTLGIYSAWAKVRNAQYFYGHTEVAGSRFAYLANPLTILKGRIIAVILFVAYSVISNVYPTAGVVLALALLIALPWVVIRSLRFNMRMSAWRNVRFGFDGEIGEAVMVFILWPLLGVLTLGLLFPLALYKQNEFIINNTRFGTAEFSLRPCAKSYFMNFVVAIAILLGAGAVAWIVSLFFPPLSPLVVALAYFYVFAFISVRSNNLIYNNSLLRDGDFAFHCFWKHASYLKLLFVNSLFILLTLGFYFPWAKVRFARYKAEHLELLGNADLDSFVASEKENVTALGEELGDIFDMEVGL